MLGRPAPRPYYSALGSERRGARLLPDWQAGLAAYLAEREGAGRGHIGDADGGAGLAEEAAGR
jgi:hypothetical protein